MIFANCCIHSSAPCLIPPNTHSSILSIICASFIASPIGLCPKSHAHSSFDGSICASFTDALIDFDLFPMPNAHSSFDNFIFVHPSLLHCFTFAPCLMHTPPLTTLFVHPLLLHHFTFAPCLMYTPPLRNIYASFTAANSVAPCLTHTPLFWGWFGHPSAGHLHLHFILDIFANDGDSRFRFKET